MAQRATIQSDIISQNVAGALDAARAAERPFRHWLLADLLPPGVRDAIVALPVQAAAIRDTAGRRETNNDTRVYFSAENCRRFAVCGQLARAFRSVPLGREPFDHIVVRDFIRPAMLPELQRDYPKLAIAGSVPPLQGTLLAFRRSETSWHGHESYEGPRRAIQMNWVRRGFYAWQEQLRHRAIAWWKLRSGTDWRLAGAGTPGDRAA